MRILWTDDRIPSVHGGSDSRDAVDSLGRTHHRPDPAPMDLRAIQCFSQGCPEGLGSCSYATPASGADLLGELLDLLVGASAGWHEAFDLLDAVEHGGVVALEELADLDQRQARQLA